MDVVRMGQIWSNESRVMGKTEPGPEDRGPTETPVARAWGSEGISQNMGDSIR